jgi:hypothetical protein
MMRSAVIAIVLALLPVPAMGQADTQSFTRELKPVAGLQAFLAGIVHRMEMVKDISPFTDSTIATRCFRYVLSRYPSPSLNLKRKRVGPKIAFNAEQQSGFAECLADDGYRLK